jgi:hypothetical protein
LTRPDTHSTATRKATLKTTWRTMLFLSVQTVHTSIYIANQLP